MSSSASEIDADLVPPFPIVTEVPISEHLEAVAPRHRNRVVTRSGGPWSMSHLEPFALQIDPGLGFEVTVVVYFSSHCFTRSVAWDGRHLNSIPVEELFREEQDVRVLCERRYSLSLNHLPRLIKELPRRVIRIARESPQNFVTIERVDLGERVPPPHYVVFFELSRDTKRKRRLVLKVQSAYLKEPFDPALSKGRKVSFAKLLKATFLRHRLRA